MSICHLNCNITISYLVGYFRIKLGKLNHWLFFFVRGDNLKGLSKYSIWDFPPEILHHHIELDMHSLGYWEDSSNAIEVSKRKSWIKHGYIFCINFQEFLMKTDVEILYFLFAEKVIFNSFLLIYLIYLRWIEICQWPLNA